MRYRIVNVQLRRAAPAFTSAAFTAVAVAAALLTGCSEKPKSDPAAEAPPAAQVVTTGDVNAIKVEHPEQFPVVEAGKLSEAGVLEVTGTVMPDVSRNIPVVSLASGRVVEIAAKLGDTVKKGQLLLRVQSADISSAFATYRSAVADEKLASTQLGRAKLLFDKGALAQKDLEVAEDAEAKAKIIIENAVDQIRVLGADLNHPASTVDILAPASGVITEQNVTASAGVKTLDNSPNLFTISDLSTVWILCDVYENDLSGVSVGQAVDIRLNGYPGKVFKGHVGSIGPILDQNTRTAKVRVEMENPGMMRVGMFVDASIHGSTSKIQATVPATAVLHLHDRDWVYEPTGGNGFRRVEVVGGQTLPSKLQVITSGIAPGDKVIANALEMQNTVEQ
jgi:cobalt-zinc-cadmium efflux system membrane fusion protein